MRYDYYSRENNLPQRGSCASTRPPCFAWIPFRMRPHSGKTNHHASHRLSSRTVSGSEAALTDLPKRTERSESHGNTLRRQHPPYHMPDKSGETPFPHVRHRVQQRTDSQGFCHRQTAQPTTHRRYANHCHRHCVRRHRL